MREYVLIIYNEINHQAMFSPEKNRQYADKVRDYLRYLSKEGKLIDSHPLLTDGKSISLSHGAWKETSFHQTKEIIVACHHIRAMDMTEAISIAQGNPEFEYSNSVRIEVRPIKPKEKIVEEAAPGTK